MGSLSGCLERSLELAVALAAPPATAVAQAHSAAPTMPVIEIPAARDGATLAVVLSGDGGWADFIKRLSGRLADSGVAVVGVDLKSYLHTRRTPNAVASDIATAIATHLESWHRSRVMIVGYSRGAVVAPFVANRLQEELRAKLDQVAMLGLGFHAGFHVSLFDLLHTTTNPSDPPVLPELEALHQAGVPLVCVFGQKEKESLCRDGPDGLMTKLGRSGGHHFDGDPESLAGAILSERHERR